MPRNERFAKAYRAGRIGHEAGARAKRPGPAAANSYSHGRTVPLNGQFQQ
ncbi:MAG TPA: hypothetical protein VF645_14685 [Allosphingosinicella sp.]|jgi:hypothetical protein